MSRKPPSSRLWPALKWLNKRWRHSRCSSQKVLWSVTPLVANTFFCGPCNKNTVCKLTRCVDASGVFAVIAAVVIGTVSALYISP